jgi:uncharacterized protein (DUF302 family)
MNGLITIPSDFGPQETMSRLEVEAKAHGMTIFARVNHGALAEQAGLALRPTELILFGNPRGGTLLMQVSQTIGIDLPLKALVWQDAAGKTWISCNEPRWLAKRHSVEVADLVLASMGSTLNEIAGNAAAERSQEAGKVE